MSADFESKTTFQGLTFKLYRGEGAALLAFHLAPDLAIRRAANPAPGQAAGAGGKPWFDAYCRPGHVKARDRELFVN